MTLKRFYKIYWLKILINSINRYSNSFVQIYIASTIALFYNEALKGNTTSIIKGSISFVFIFTAVLLIQTLLSIFVELRGQKNKEALKHILYDRFLDNKLIEVEKKSSGEIFTRMDKGVDKVISGFDGALSIIVIGALSAVTYLVYLMRINLGVALGMLILGLLPIIPPYLLKNLYSNGFEKYNESADKLASFLKESIDGFDFIKLNNLYSKMEKRYKKHQEDVGESALDIEKTFCLEQGVNTGVGNISKFGSYGIVAYCFYKGIFNIGTAVEVLIISKSLFDNFKSIFDQYAIYLEAKISLRRVNEIMNKREENNDNKETVLEDIKTIKFEDVSFAYDEEKYVLNNVNLQINKGDKILLRGSNGAGKSTFIKLLMSLYEDYEGSIRVNDNDIEDLNKTSFKNKIAWVPQSQYFFGSDALSNVNLFNKGDNSIEKSLSSFNIDKGGLKDRMCDSLSGGQRQKLALIRAFTRESDFIILDEPTNHLDKEGIETLKGILKSCDKTVMVISHNEDIYDLFNKKYYIDQGRLSLVV